MPPTYNYANTSYHDRCALAEKLGDVKLRQWCVEQIGVLNEASETLVFNRVDTLLEYIKGERKNAK